MISGALTLLIALPTMRWSAAPFRVAEGRARPRGRSGALCPTQARDLARRRSQLPVPGLSLRSDRLLVLDAITVTEVPKHQAIDELLQRMLTHTIFHIERNTAPEARTCWRSSPPRLLVGWRVA